jgi:DNA processing protein
MILRRGTSSDVEGPVRARAGTRIKYITPVDPKYPEALGELRVPPEQLFAIGDLSLLERPMVAIVGTRNPTAYGERVASQLAGSFARAGAVVVSGMARGIDGTAHRAALAEGGGTIAVLGTGVDVPYPAGHASLHRTLTESGLVLSEQDPGSRPHKGSFPQRNRIIAALCRLTIVVEAGFRSGALNTANHAIDLGRHVAAVPGRIDSPESAGTNLLIRDGAQVITTVDDALALAEMSPVPAAPRAPLDQAQRRVWDALRSSSATADDLASRTGLPARECLVAVSELEIAGMVECLLTGEIRRR